MGYDDLVSVMFPAGHVESRLDKVGPKVGATRNTGRASVLGQAATGSQMAVVDRGCLVLADISGYTAYLAASELDHAQDVLADLAEVVVNSLGAVLQVSKLEGDAVLAYVLEGAYAPATVLDALEHTYSAFRSRLRDISYATSCTCKACALMPTLDLKLFIHDGSFVRRTVGEGEELIGMDVILVHRLLKNSVEDEFGFRGYLLLTQACAEALDLDPDALGLSSHLERYDDVGDVDCWLKNLDESWREELERRRVYVPTQGASFEFRFKLPVEPEVAWDWLTSAERRELWQADRIDAMTPGGRDRVGATSHCIHGADALVEEIVDWRPFRYFTKRYDFPEVGPMLVTIELEKQDEGTAAAWRGERVTGHQRSAWNDVSPVIRSMIDGMIERLTKELG